VPVNAQRGYMRLLRIAEHHARVVGVSTRSPWLKRIRFSAPELVESFDGHPGEWIRLWVPDSSKGGLLRQRGYTVAGFSYEGGWFDIDVVLHSPDGPASAWARAVRPGAEVVISFSRPKEHLGGTEPLTLLADTSSLPAVEAICEHLAAGSREIRVFLDAQGHDVAGLLSAPGARVVITEDPVAAFASASPQEGGFVWARLERSRVSALKAVLKAAGTPRSSVHAQAYWIKGRGFA
jgi:NADPH-dependent ferric siderophore reductase